MYVPFDRVFNLLWKRSERVTEEITLTGRGIEFILDTSWDTAT